MFPVQAVAVASFIVLFRNTQMGVFKSTTNEQDSDAKDILHQNNVVWKVGKGRIATQKDVAFKK